MTEPMTAPAGSGGAGLTIVVDRNRIAIIGHLRTPTDIEQLKHRVGDVLASLKDLADDSELVVDVTRAAYLDVGALTALLTTARRCRDHGRTLAIEGVNVEVREQLRATHLDQVFHSHRARITDREDR